jgi:16S rRNA (cytidine1402-2'-O)-methyltransferase
VPDAERKGAFVVVGTPIGNLADLTPRASDALRTADVVAAEDTRRTLKLLQHVGSKAQLMLLNDTRATASAIDSLLDRVEDGAVVALVSDAGMPTVSDPGAKIIDRAYERGLRVMGVPGPSAVTLALALSGFFAQRFVFLGFLSKKPGRLKETLSEYAESPLPIVLFERPERLTKVLEAALEVLGDRRVAVCREMTKMHEEVRRGRISALLGQESVKKGELTVVVEGKRRFNAERDE